jgi:hypothetical protein
MMKIKFSTDEIPYWAGRYTYPTEYTANDISARIRGAEFIEKDDFLALCKWKSQRSINHCMKNTPDFIKEVTRVAFHTNNEQLRIKTFTLLEGVSWPTASVLLHFGHKDPYPIMDFRALWSLGVDNPPNPYTFDFWWEYTKYCRDLSKSAEVSMRILDKALWQYSKENQGKDHQENGNEKINEAISLTIGIDVIKLPYGGKDSSFLVNDLLSYMKSMNKDYIIQGGVNCYYEEHPKPHSLDYWLRSFYSRNKDTKQAVNSVIDDLISTGLFTLDEKLICPDSGRLCKGIIFKCIDCDLI